MSLNPLFRRCPGSTASPAGSTSVEACKCVSTANNNCNKDETPDSDSNTDSGSESSGSESTAFGQGENDIIILCVIVVLSMCFIGAGLFLVKKMFCTAPTVLTGQDVQLEDSKL